MAQNRPLTRAAQNFFAAFNQAQERKRRQGLVELEFQKRQDILRAAELKREQELADREDLALSIEQSLGIDLGDDGTRPSREPGPVEDTGIFPAPQRTNGIAGEDITEGGVPIPSPPTGAERRGPGRRAGFTFTQKQRKAFSEAVAINPSVSAPILNFLSKSNEFQLQQESNRTGRLLRGGLFLQDQIKKSPVLFQEGIKQLVESGIYGPQEVNELVQLSNEPNPDLVNLKLEKLVLDNTPRKILLEEEVAKRKGLREEQSKIREEARGEQIAIRAEERKPTAFQSPIGKLVADKEAATSSFGAASPQVIAIQEAIDAENKGEPASLTDVAGIRKEFTKLSGDFIKLRDAVKKVRRGGEAISAAGDLALIFNFMKILDPSSVVRESEFATAQNSAGVPDRIRNTWNRLLRGERLAPKQRADFVDRANQLFEGQRDSQINLENSFRNLATSQGMKPEDVVVDFIGEFRPSGESTKTIGRFKVEVE